VNHVRHLGRLPLGLHVHGRRLDDFGFMAHRGTFPGLATPYDVFLVDDRVENPN
jgi:hypothetical protein